MQPTEQPDIILDTSSLIIVAKLLATPYLNQTYGMIGIPPAVYSEAVVVGKHRRKSDAYVIETAIQSGYIQVLKLTPRQNQLAQNWSATSILGLGECEALAYAKDQRVQLMIEDRKARIFARSEGITYTTLQVFPLQGYIEQKVTYEICVNLLERVAVAMNTDLAILKAFKLAVDTIRRERQGE